MDGTMEEDIDEAPEGVADRAVEGVGGLPVGTVADRTGVGNGTRVRTLTAAEQDKLPRDRRKEARANYWAVRAR